jgi:hypothetical protein
MFRLAGMEKVELKLSFTWRTTERLRHEFGNAVSRLGMSRRARIFGGKATKEYVNAALWHFFSSMTEKEGEAFLAEWFPKLEEALRQEEMARRDEAEPPGGKADPSRDALDPKLPVSGKKSNDEGPKPSRRRGAR